MLALGGRDDLGRAARQDAPPCGSRELRSAACAVLMPSCLDLETSVKYVAAAYGLVWIAHPGLRLADRAEARAPRGGARPAASASVARRRAAAPSRSAPRRRRAQGGRVNRVVVAGVSHHTAPLDRARAPRARRRARTRCLVGGVVARGRRRRGRRDLDLQPHRALPRPARRAATLHEVAIAELLAIAGEHDPLPHDAFYVHRGERALLHLYRVAARPRLARAGRGRDARPGARVAGA